ncbi:unnamed protein product [Tuber melanosporum]|uniref:(Perigord truffle) hypothetical protein n=1 Tax=Tuber melanosporum (strain Mel28) TaxID=656061 RepID=D5G8Z5_TUBMM|nr:uncharacterized protein GSTUM_00004909001 [Tuber melanosporum]CAZ80988.1 unnamed protein product [Tuber melanosporum]
MEDKECRVTECENGWPTIGCQLGYCESYYGIIGRLESPPPGLAGKKHSENIIFPPSAGINKKKEEIHQTLASRRGNSDVPSEILNYFGFYGIGFPREFEWWNFFSCAGIK